MKFKRLLLTFLVVGFALSNIAILYNLYNSSLAPDSSSAASEGRLLLNLSSPSTLASAPNNSTISLSLTAQNTTDVSTAEIVINYNPSVLEGLQMIEDSNILLALNKRFDNALGRATIDIAYIGSGNLPENTNLVTFNFKVLNNSINTSSVSVAQGSTMGVPNQLASNGMGSLAINFGTGSQAQNPPPATPNPSPNPTPTPTPTPNPTPVPPSQGGTDNGGTPTTPDTAGEDKGEVVDEEEPVVPQSPVDEEEVVVTNEPTTTSTPSIKYQSSSDIINTDNNRTTLTVLLIVTISGTVGSLFFLIKELFIKKESHNPNPFM